MDVKVTEHVVEPTPPPKTYDVEFRGLTLDEFVILRTALSDGITYRGRVKDRHLHRFRSAIDQSCRGAHGLMLNHYDRVLREE